VAGDREVAADQVDRERRRLRQDVVPELGDELLVIEVEADPEDVAEPLGDVGALPVGGAVDMDFLVAVGRWTTMGEDRGGGLDLSNGSHRNIVRG